MTRIARLFQTLKRDGHALVRGAADPTTGRSLTVAALLKACGHIQSRDRKGAVAP